MMRLAIESRTRGDAEMAILRADGDPAVRRAAKWLAGGQRPDGRALQGDELLPEQRSEDVFERLYPDIDIIIM